MNDPDESLTEPNPYRSPSFDSPDMPKADPGFSRAQRLAAFAPATIALVYFLAMVVAWTMHWIRGRIVMWGWRQFSMYVLAWGCVFGTAWVFYCLVRNRRYGTLRGLALTGIAFAIMIAVEWSA